MTFVPGSTGQAVASEIRRKEVSQQHQQSSRKLHDTKPIESKPKDHKEPVSKKPKISAVEARRLKYMNLKANSSKKGSKQRDDNTMSKLSEFKSKMCSRNRGS